MAGGRRQLWRAILAAIGVLSMYVFVSSAPAGDLGIVPLFDGERSDTLDLWGGPLNAGSGATFTKESGVVHSGTNAYQLNVGSVTSGDFRFFQAFSSAVTSFTNYRQDRDLTRYQTLQGYI